jgi:hypothetical protein
VPRRRDFPEVRIALVKDSGLRPLSLERRWKMPVDAYAVTRMRAYQ